MSRPLLGRRPPRPFTSPRSSRPCSTRPPHEGPPGRQTGYTSTDSRPDPDPLDPSEVPNHRANLARVGTLTRRVSNVLCVASWALLSLVGLLVSLLCGG